MTAAGILDGIFGRMCRAYDHLETLNGELESFLSGDHYAYNVEPNADSTKYWIYFVEDSVPAPLVSVLIGECIQNARIALDYTVSALARPIIATLAPTEREGAERVCQFPICESSQGFKEQSRRLRYVPPLAKATIEGMQPYQRCPGNPLDSPLWHLSNLSNTDKHRLLVTTATYPTGGQLITRSYPGEFVRARMKRGPLKHGAPFAVAIFSEPSANVDMQLRTHFIVCLESGDRLVGVGHLLFWCLAGVIDAIRAMAQHLS